MRLRFNQQVALRGEPGGRECLVPNLMAVHVGVSVEQTTDIVIPAALPFVKLS